MDRKYAAIRHTVTLNHEGFYHIMPDHLKVRVTDPVRDGCFRAREEVVKNGDFVAKEHKAIH